MVTIDASVLVASDAADEVAHDAARSFLRAVLAAGIAVHEPTLAIVEVTAAITRRSGDPALGRSAGLGVLRLPGATIHALDVRTAALAAGLASDLGLRGADAIYAATALASRSTLVTLDGELAARASAVVATMSPAEWLDAHATPSET